MADVPHPESIVHTINSQPGIKRDGTLLEGNFCTDGQWVRFQRGKPRKMGGYRRITASLTGPVLAVRVWSREDLNIVTSFSKSAVESLLVDNNIVGNNILTRTPSSFASSSDNMWTSDTMYDAAAGSAAAVIVAHCNQSMTNIDSTTASAPYWALASSSSSTFAAITDAPHVSGGIVALAPYLVAFGSDGFVAWSDANQPQTWSTSSVPGDAGEARVTGSKIVAGLPLRAGSLACLLWSLDSIIRMDYVGGQAIWKFSVLSTQSSILASNCVIEYDGVYFWIGIDRFMYFDSSVKELPNDLNQNWFFDNLNFAYRQKIWATKIPRYGEVIWHYPRGDSTVCNATIIFNTRLKTWYDNSVSRSAGFYSQVLRCPVWADSAAESSGKYALYQHEFGVDAVVGDNVTAIPSYYMTQNFGYPTGSIGEGMQGLNVWTRITRLEPDFRQEGDMTCYVIGYSYAQTPTPTTATYTFDQATGRIDMREQVRHILLKFESNQVGGDYQAGEIIVHIEPGDARLQ